MNIKYKLYSIAKGEKQSNCWYNVMCPNKDDTKEISINKWIAQ